jgi:predicted aspartyl protease
MRIPERVAVTLVLLLAGGVGLSAETPQHSAPLDILRGKPFVMVTVNGKGPFRFLLDTGTGGAAMVTAELADELHLPAAGETQLNDPSGMGGRSAPMVRIDSLSVAGVEFSGIRAVRHAIPGAEGQCLGMLGFPLFEKWLLTVDYPQRRMTLTEGALESDGERRVLPFRMQDGVPVVTLWLGGQEGSQIEAQLDTGGGGLSLPEPVAARQRFSQGPEVFGKGESLSTRFALRAGKLAGDVRLGVYTLDRPWVEINPAFPLANVGGVPLEYFALTFDQRNGLVRFESPLRHIKLGVTPAPAELSNRPPMNPAQQGLTPVG